jgi:Phosphomannomutase
MWTMCSRRRRARWTDFGWCSTARTERQSVVAPLILRRAGATVIEIGTAPDGLNINEGCGSTHLEALQAAVIEHGADAGIAHDGDADRCLAVTGSGETIDGDQIMAILALELREAGRLQADTVVATVMSNLGFKLAMREAGLTVVETRWATDMCSRP